MKSKDDNQVRMIPIDRIRIVNPRTRDKKKFEQIMESIAVAGLKKPITVTVGEPGPDGGEMYDLVCGQGRLEAMGLLGQKLIPAIVRDFSKTDGLLASLVENIARRRVRALDQIQMIQWMRDQGHSNAEIGRKTGLAEGYVKIILAMIRNGEERLLEATLRGRIPVSIAAKISGVPDDDSQRLLMEAYEKKELSSKTLSAFKRIVELRRNLGRGYGKRHSGQRHRTSVDGLVWAYRQETQRQRLMVKKARLCEARLLSVAAAFKLLLGDENFTTLLRAEGLQTMPKFLAERAQQST